MVRVTSKLCVLYAVSFAVMLCYAATMFYTVGNDVRGVMLDKHSTSPHQLAPTPASRSRDGQSRRNEFARDWDAEQERRRGLLQSTSPQLAPMPASRSRDDQSRRKESAQDWDAEQQRRRAILREACARYPRMNMSFSAVSRQVDRLWPLIYDDKYKVIYCTICKVASTTLKSALLVLMGKYPTIERVDFGEWYTLDRSLHTLSELPSAEIERRLQTYKKFIFVREPFSRELSGFRNKLYAKNDYYPKKIGTTIIRQFRANATKEALETGEGVTFTEFAKHLTKAETLDSLDVHWRPMHAMVLPCSMEYDNIGHLETAQWDIENILNRTGIGKVVKVPETPMKLSNSDDIFHSFYQELEPSLLRDMYNTFRMDSELFGYDIPLFIRDKLGDL